MPISLSVRTEAWPIAGSFAISRGRKTQAQVVVAELRDGDAVGRGECVPYARYGETVATVVRDIENLRPRLASGLGRIELQAALPAGAARNALDCAFWDLEAKRAGRPVHELAGLPAPRPLVTAYTISLDTPQAMARAAGEVASRPLLKLKLGGPEDGERLQAVRKAAPRAELIVDANEAWTADELAAKLAACAAANVRLVEQPLAASGDTALANLQRPIPVCADESVHDRKTLSSLATKYEAINIKLDKAGGLTEALALAAEAQRAGFAIMVGCMVATSLSMAPAMLLAQRAQWVDLDGPLLLAHDRKPGLHYVGSTVEPARAELWG